MPASPSLETPLATLVGLAIALLGAPLVTALFRQVNGDAHSDLQVVIRELACSRPLACFCAS